MTGTQRSTIYGEQPPVNDPPPEAPPTDAHETLIGARVLWSKPIRGNVLVQFGDQYGLIPENELTGPHLTMVNAAKLQTPPTLITGAFDLNVLLWRSGIMSKDDLKERARDFYQLVLAEAAKLLE